MEKFISITENWFLSWLKIYTGGIRGDAYKLHTSATYHEKSKKFYGFLYRSCTIKKEKSFDNKPEDYRQQKLNKWSFTEEYKFQ